MVLQEYNPGDDCSQEVTVMRWDFKDDSPQPILGALVYSLTHILHNLPDLEALRLLKKLSDAMESYSRLLIHEFAKNSTYGKMHATMIQLYAGRVRSSREWKQLADLAGLQATFEAYPVAGEGLVEMRKIEKRRLRRLQTEAIVELEAGSQEIVLPAVHDKLIEWSG
jgi:O-methyltransferase domain